MSRSAEAVLATVQLLDHPTADEVWGAMRAGPTQVSRATVYRNLAHLVTVGRLRIREIGHHKRYDPHVEPHVHIHDADTGALHDVPMTTRLKDALADLTAGLLETQDDVIIEVTGRMRNVP